MGSLFNSPSEGGEGVYEIRLLLPFQGLVEGGGQSLLPHFSIDRCRPSSWQHSQNTRHHTRQKSRNNDHLTSQCSSHCYFSHMMRQLRHFITKFSQLFFCFFHDLRFGINRTR